MTPEQLVPSLETCKKLQEAGYPQNGSCFMYHIEEKPIFQDHISNKFLRNETVISIKLRANLFDGEQIAAPTLQELLEELPSETTGSNFLEMSKDIGFYEIGYLHMPNDAWDNLISHTNPSEAAALLWLELKKGGK